MSDPIIIAAIITGIFTLIAAISGGLIAQGKLLKLNFLRGSKIPEGFVIFINGSSGVGKTTIAGELANKYNIPSIIGTDLIREVLREERKNDKSCLIHSSSFMVQSYSDQCEIMAPHIKRIVDRIKVKRDPAIIEGVNIMASQLFEEKPDDPFSISIDPYTKCLFITLHLDSDRAHRRRLHARGESYRSSKRKYTNDTNFNQIRKINEDIKSDSNKENEKYKIKYDKKGDEDGIIIHTIENSIKNETINKIDKLLKKKLKKIKVI